jgi:hypothetical protein
MLKRFVEVFGNTFQVFWELKLFRWANLSRPVEGITIPQNIGNSTQFSATPPSELKVNMTAA